MYPLKDIFHLSHIIISDDPAKYSQKNQQSFHNSMFKFRKVALFLLNVRPFHTIDLHVTNKSRLLLEVTNKFRFSRIHAHTEKLCPLLRGHAL